jgi:hypothetical protein
MEVTKKHLDKQFGKYFNLTKEYLEQRLTQQTKELKVFVTNFVKAENADLVSLIQETIVEPIDNRFDIIESRLDTIDNRFDGLESKLDQHIEKTDRYDKAVQQIAKVLRVKLAE